MGMKQVHDVEGNALPTDPHLPAVEVEVTVHTKEPADLALVDDAVKQPPEALLDPTED